MTRRKQGRAGRSGGLGVVFFGGLCALVAGFGMAHAADTAPNILFIFSDDHALRTISAYGGEAGGRLLEYLEKAGLAENTIVIYSSDQGFFLGENGWTDKRLMDDVTMSMPFLIRWPGKVKPGQRIEAMIQNIDYAPTILDAAGVAVPDDMDGRSLLPLFGGETPEDWRDSLYYQYHQAGAYNLPKIEGVRNDRYKLIRYFGHPKLEFGEQWELFDLKKDPTEQKSEFANPEYASVVKTMRAELAKLREEFDVKK